MMDKEKQLETPQNSTPGETPQTEQDTAAEQAPEIELDPSEAAAHPQVTLDEEVVKLLEEEAAEFESAATTTEGEGAHLQEEVSALTTALSAMTNQLEDIKTQYARLAADFDNFRKRTQKEKEELTQQVQCTTIKELLPVVDNFERARSQIKPQTDAEMNIHKSYQGVYKQMVDCLKRLGVSPMRPEGQEFDPNLHEAVMREATNEHPEGTVLEELMRGYIMGDRVLRHAMVKVSTAPEESDSSDDAEESAQESAGQ
jgi:molecular chaperone GrpE